MSKQTDAQNTADFMNKKLELMTEDVRQKTEDFLAAVKSAENEFNGREDLMEVCAVQIMKMLHSRVEEFWRTRYTHCTNQELFALLSIIDSIMETREKEEAKKREQAALKAKAENDKKETDTVPDIAAGIPELESAGGGESRPAEPVVKAKKKGKAVAVAN